MQRLFVLCIAFVVAGCGAVNKHIPPATEAACTNAGGTWNPIPGMREELYCDLRTADAGKWCFDSMQCEGSCLAAEEAKIGSFAMGHCAGHTQDLGAANVVSIGKVAAPGSVR